MSVQVRRAAWLDPEWWRGHPSWGVSLVLGTVVAAFSGLWAKGSILLDGRGIALYARLATSYLSHLDRIPYWMPDVWAGSPVWALGPSFPLFLLVPLTTVVGGATAVKTAILIFQVVGGLGAYTLTRSLWGRGPAPVLAGLIYSLHPMVVSHGALAGVEGLVAVMAATPWLAWSFRKALLGHGDRYVVASGLIAAFAVLHQAEHALALPLLCAVMLVVEVARPRDDPGAVRPGKLLSRAAAVIGIGLAACAFWLLPLASMRDSFVLSPPELVQAELSGGAAAQISNEIGVFFDRPQALSGTVSYYRTGLFPQFFYVGLVCLALTLTTLVLLLRRRREGEPETGGERHLVAILFASAMAMWFSTGSVPLLQSGPALRDQVVPLAATGLAAGLLIGCLLRHVHLGRFRVLGLVAGAGLLASLPFVTPYLTLQKVVPIFAVIRFPRFYTLAALGFALGAAYPVTALQRWVRRRPEDRRLVPAALALGIAVVFLVDVLPFRSLYEVGPPVSGFAYRQASQALPADSRLSRVATGLLEPGAASALIDNGWLLSSGWPHPVAGRQLWHLTGETYPGPPGFRAAALGLSSTGYIAVEDWQKLGTAEESVAGVQLVRNDRALPLLRTYEQAVVVDDPELSPFLATALAYRNVGVVTRRQPLDTLLGEMPTAAVPSSAACTQPSLAELRALAGEVSVACTIDPWLSGLLRGTELVPVDRRPGATFTAQANGLRGIAVWLDTVENQSEVSLFELGADGFTLGAEVARAQAVGTDEYGLTAFTFDPVNDSAGRRFAFVVSCNRCPGEKPHLIAGSVSDGSGNLVDSGLLRTERIVVQTPIYDRVPPATTPSTRVTATGRGPGSWDIDIDAPNPALLVVAETWFPGWKATIDGKSTPVLQADGAFLGVAVGAGAHQIHIEYHRPVAADVGRLITFGTLLGLAVVGWRRGRRARRTGPGAAGVGPDVGPDGDGPRPADEPEWEAAVARAPRPPTRGRGPGPGAGSPGDGSGADPNRRPRPGRPGPPPPRRDRPTTDPG